MFNDFIQLLLCRTAHFFKGERKAELDVLNFQTIVTRNHGLFVSCDYDDIYHFSGFKTNKTHFIYTLERKQRLQLVRFL